jgi:hypothetical protein
MSDFASNGFLGLGISTWTNGYHELYSPWLKIYTEFNSFAQDVLFRCDVPSGNLRLTLAKTLFIRILSNYQGVYLLAERGMEAETTILLRSLCEATFALVAILKQVDFAARYIGHNEAKRLQNIESLLSGDSEAISADVRAEMINQREILKAKKAAGKIKALKS